VTSKGCCQDTLTATHVRISRLICERNGAEKGGKENKMARKNKKSIILR